MVKKNPHPFAFAHNRACSKVCKCLEVVELVA